MPHHAAADIFDEDTDPADVTGQVQALTDPAASMFAEVHRQLEECDQLLDQVRDSLRPLARRLLVLLVDDEAQALTAMAVSLERVGISVDGASNAGDAKARCRTTHYDGAVIDVWLPGASGVQLAQELRAECPYMPILLISGDGAARQEAMRLSGAAGWLSKPFGPLELLGALREIIPDLKGL